MTKLFASAALAASLFFATFAQAARPAGAPTAKFIIATAKADLGESYSHPSVRWGKDGVSATVYAMEFGGGPIHVGATDLKRLAVAAVTFANGQVTNVTAVPRGIMPLAMTK